MTTVNLLIVGTGAVGGLYASRFSKDVHVKVSVICRSNFEAVKNKGIQIRSEQYGNYTFMPTRVFSSIDEAANLKLRFDILVITMKNHPDVYSIPKLIKPLVMPATTIVLIQNGVEIEKPFLEEYPNTPLISCVALVAASELEAGIIVHKNVTRLSNGIFPKESSKKYAQAITTFSGILLRGGIDHDIVEDIESLRWFKLMWNGSISPLCILANKCDTYHLLNDKDATQLVRDIMVEIKYLAEKVLGTALTLGPFPTIEDYILTTKHVHYKPSLLLDFERKKPLELETTLGAIVRFAKRLDHPVPISNAIYTILKLADKRNRGLLTTSDDN